jgi:hypothetical protein
LNNNGKPWSLYHFGDVTFGLRNSDFAITENTKSGYNYRLVQVAARQVVCIKHSKETVVELSNGDVTAVSRRPLVAEIDKPPLLTNEKRT